jgi:hypothetical protein
MKATLQKRFYFMLAPALIGIGGVWVFRTMRMVAPVRPAGTGPWAPVLFFLSMVTAAAAPDPDSGFVRPPHAAPQLDFET